MITNAEVLTALREQHDAIDTLFALLINMSRDSVKPKPFFPSQSGQPWRAIRLGNTAIAGLEKRTA